MKANAGEELICHAREFDFDHDGVKKRRGVLSYYATKTMAQATTMDSWLKLIDKSSLEDLTKGVISELYKPEIMITGNPDFLLPGDS